MYALMNYTIVYCNLKRVSNKPMRLLDRMLARVASDMPYALYFFDSAGKCIWSNKPGRRLLHVRENEYEKVPKRLAKLFGPLELRMDTWRSKREYGSGYSSLNLLKDMPVDVLKIDMKFLSKSTNNYRARTIVQNIIKLSDDLGIASLTEGVETDSQYKMLTDMGCKLFQGYHFAKPLSLEEFTKNYL